MKTARTAKAVATVPRKTRKPAISEGLKETIDLLSRPANARRLRSALAQAKAGKLKERDL
jgi:hypothetical protein